MVPVHETERQGLGPTVRREGPFLLPERKPCPWSHQRSQIKNKQKNTIKGNTNTLGNAKAWEALNGEGVTASCHLVRMAESTGVFPLDQPLQAGVYIKGQCLSALNMQSVYLCVRDGGHWSFQEGFIRVPGKPLG